MDRGLYSADHEVYRQAIKTLVQREVVANLGRWEQERRGATYPASSFALQDDILTPYAASLGSADQRSRSFRTLGSRSPRSRWNSM